MRYAQIRPLEFGGELLLPGGELLEDKHFKSFFQNSGYVLLGETHTNMTDHMSQAAILEKMAKRRLKPVIGMEMVNVDNQHILDRFNRGEMQVDKLEEALNWPLTVGFAFDLFRPIFEVAAKYKIPVYALNIPRHVVREARLNGLDKVAEKDKKYLPGNFIAVSEPQRKYLLKFFEDHLDRAPGQEAFKVMSSRNGGEAAKAQRPGAASTQVAKLKEQDSSRPAPPPTPEELAKLAAKAKSVEGFMTAQAVWDSAMAERAVRVRQASKRPVVIIVGQGHVEYGWGIALRLKTYDEEARVISVLPWRAPMESVFMQKQRSPLLDSALPPIFPPPDLADAFYYSPGPASIGKTPHGLVTGENPSARRPQLIVLAVEPESPAEKSGFLTGDLILQLNKRTIAAHEEFYSALAQASAYGATLEITVQRGAEKIILELAPW